MKIVQIKKFLEKRGKFITYLFFIICLAFLIHRSFEDFSKVDAIISRNYEIFLIVIICSMINLNIVSYRFYFYLKKTLNYSGKFTNWSKLFFQTVVMNFMIGGSGHIVRAIKLKKEKINYTQFITINYVIYILILFINLILFMFFFYYFSNKEIILLGLIFILFALYILLIPAIYHYILNILNKNKIFNNNIYKKIKNILNYLISHLTKKKNLFNFSFLTLIIFFFEGCIIFLISSNILNTQNIFNILQLFFVVFYLNKIIYVNNLIGINELIAGLLAETMGYYFLQGALIQLIFRISIYLGCIINYSLYFALKYKIIK